MMGSLDPSEGSLAAGLIGISFGRPEPLAADNRGPERGVSGKGFLDRERSIVSESILISILIRRQKNPCR